MPTTYSTTDRPSRAWCLVIAFLTVVALTLGTSQASAQARDPLWNGLALGAAAGAVAGVAFTHAVRDSDLTFGQYAYGGLIFGAFGAGIGLGIDALLNRTAPVHAPPAPRLVIAPVIRRHVKAVAVRLRF